MKENYGDLEALKKLGKEKKHTFTEEQLCNENLKNIGGESCKEVQKRVQKFFEMLIKMKECNHVAVISHGASIKFFLKQYCELNENKELTYKTHILRVNAPSVFQMNIMEEEMTDIIQIYG